MKNKENEVVKEVQVSEHNRLFTGQRFNRTVNNWSNIWFLTKRNILKYTRNRGTLFFSLLAPFLIFLIYILFLPAMQETIVRGELSNRLSSDPILLEQINTLLDSKKGILNAFVNTWMLAGVIGMACMSVAVTSMQVILNDKDRGQINDFIASPMKLINLTASYFLAAFLVTFMITFIFLFVAVIFISIQAGAWLFSFLNILQLLLTLVISCLSAVILDMVFVSFFRTVSGFGAFNGVYSGLIGFLTGAYFPLSIMPIWVQTIAGFVPATHSLALFRSILTRGMFTKLLDGATPEIIEAVNDIGFQDFKMFGVQFENMQMVLYLVATTVLFFFLYLLINTLKSQVRIRRKGKFFALVRRRK